MKAVVAGGCGFIGSHVCERLLSSGHKVVCIDNLSSGCLDNIAHLRENEGFCFLNKDITEKLDIDADIIFNLACIASPVRYQAAPIDTMKTSVVGTLQLLELAHKNGARLIHASSSEVYGSPEIHPQPEHYWGHVNPNGPRACYNEGKRASETLCFDHHQIHGTLVKVARIFNTYGPRMRLDDGRVIPNFISQCLERLPISVHGKGEQTRSFCYIDDLVDGLFLLSETPNDFVGPINLGNPSEINMTDLAKAVADVVGVNVVLEYHDRPIDDPQKRCPDITLAQKSLGWSPKVPLSEGIAITKDHYLSRREMSE